MKPLVILLAITLVGCSQVIGAPDRSTGHGGTVHITTEKPDQKDKPGIEEHEKHKHGTKHA